MNIICSLLFLISLPVFGHGENKPGPHGGHIRMPGAFHTELVAEKEKFKIFLLDMAFQNPTTTDSSISLKHNPSGKMFSCRKEKDHFLCELPSADLSQGSLEMKAQRKGVKGREVSYHLPLAFKAAPMSMDHSHHSHHSHH